MADELDKFVLQYTVDSKDAEKRLEDLNKKVGKVNDGAEGALEGFSKFGEGASEQLGKIVPGVDAVSGAVKLMSGEFAMAAAAVAILAAGIKSLIDLRDTFERQRKMGMEVGMSGIQLEELERKFVKTSGGRVTREEVGENVKSFRDKVGNAFADVSNMGIENRIFRKLGINIRGRNGPKDTTQLMGEVGAKLKKMSPSKSQGISQFLGFSKDFEASLKQMGESVSKVTEMSYQEINARTAAEAQMRTYNTTVAVMKEKFTEAEQELATKLLPLLTQLALGFANMAADLPNIISGFSDLGDDLITMANPMNYIKETADKMFSNSPLAGSEPTDPKTQALMDQINKLDDTDYNKRQQAAAQKTVDDKNRENSQARQTTDKFQRAINMFVGAVASFANAIDDQQAMAAWAGEIGTASGIATPAAISGRQAPVIASQPVVSTPISAPNNNETSSQTVGDVLLGKTQSPLPQRVESPADTPLPGDTDRKMSRSTIRTGDTTTMGPGGESRRKINLRSVQSTISQRLGVPLEQIQSGGVNRGDVEFASRQLQAGIMNGITQMKRQLMMPGMPKSARSKIMTEIRRQQQGLGFMREYSGQVVGGAREGARNITIGERAIIINVSGAMDHMQMADTIGKHLQTHLNDIVNNSTTGIKY